MSLYLPPTSRVGVLHNPAATNADTIKDFQRQLFDAGYDHEVIYTSPDVDGTAANIVDFDPRAGDIFAVHAGDGGYNNATNAIIDLGLNNYTIPVLGGKACDNVRSYYGNATFFDVLHKGLPTRMHPLDMYIDTPKKPNRMHRAVGYIGLNGTPLAARGLEPIREPVKQLRNNGHEFAAQKQEALTSLNAVASAPPMIAVYEGSEHTLADLTFAKISRIAREGRIHADPFDNSYYRRVATRTGGNVAIATRMLMLKFGVIFGDKMTEESEIAVYSETGDPIALHIDGEVAQNGQPLEVDSGSTITAGISKKFFRTIRIYE